MLSADHKACLAEYQEKDREIAKWLPPLNSRILKWCNQRLKKFSIQCVTFALQTPATVDRIREFIKDRNNRNVLFELSSNDQARWLGYWTDTSSMWSDVLQVCEHDFDSGNVLLEVKGQVAEVVQFFERSPAQRTLYFNKHRNEFDLGIKLAYLGLRMALAAAYQYAIGNRDDSEFEFNDRARLAILFFVNVWYPCNDKYHLEPSELLKASATGSVEATESILRIDRHATILPAVRNALTHCTTPSIESIYRQAIASPVNINSKAAHMKALLAAWLIEFSRFNGLLNKKFRKKYSNNDMRELFNAHVFDQSGELTDSSLPIGDSAWNEQIRVCRRNFPVEKLQVF